MVISLAQLADLQFVTYSDIFSDINEILCPELTFKQIKDDIAVQGGFLTMIHALVHRINVLEETIKDLQSKQFLQEHVIQDMVQAEKHQSINTNSNNLCDDTLRSLIYNISLEVANDVFRNKINGLTIHYSGGDYR